MKKYYFILLMTLVFSLFSSDTEGPVFFETHSSVQAAEQEKPKKSFIFLLVTPLKE